MIPAILSQIRRPRVLATLVGISALLAGPVTAQVTPVGGTARNFTVTNRANNQPINLTGFAGKILVIDFFAYWCGTCQDASPDVETNIQKYYASRGGNAYGVPVVVLAASIDASSPSQTDAFVANAGLELAAEDNGGSSGAWSQFNSAGSIPLFVIINCAASSPNTAQWKVLYKQAGYAGAPALRSVIDAVQAPSPEILSFDFPGMGMPTARIIKGQKETVLKNFCRKGDPKPRNNIMAIPIHHDARPNQSRSPVTRERSLTAAYIAVNLDVTKPSMAVTNDTTSINVTIRLTSAKAAGPR